MSEENIKSAKGNCKTVFCNRKRKKECAASILIAYDLETTRIGNGTPRPLFLTAYSRDIEFSFQAPVRSIEHLRSLVITNFLKKEFAGVKFVGWNANHFDAYFIAAALILEPGYIIKPFLTRSKNLRGFVVYLACENDLRPKYRSNWYFLDGMSMTGLIGVSLDKFLKTFAPDYQKKKDLIDFDVEDFDPLNLRHVDYAMRDSEGLYYGIRRAENILIEYFNEPLSTTIGRTCIRIFQSFIPENVKVIRPSDDFLNIVREYVMRGGYCYSVKKYIGLVWKYDINQAYAAAMRDALLPCGNVYRVEGKSRYASIFIARVKARNEHNKIPFYYKTLINNKVRARFDLHEIAETWLTSIEINQLESEGWTIEWFETIVFDSKFSMSDYVNRLEHIRSTCSGGPSGAIGMMIKAVGNHSYGKTVEELEPLDLIISKDCPEGYAEYFPEELDSDELYFPHVWYKKVVDELVKDYHQPQIGSFITAHVRMVLRRAILVDPDAWIYADTDCLVFCRDVSLFLDIDIKRYGAFKIEANGEHYSFLGKKIYASVAEHDGKPIVAHAKGMNVKKLTSKDFTEWGKGTRPEQRQIHRNNFLKVMRGESMFVERVRKGTAL